MDEYNPYKNMTLRQELEARFDEADRKQKEQEALDYIRNNMQYFGDVFSALNPQQYAQEDKSYTTGDVWGYPNTSNSSMYNAMGRPYSFDNNVNHISEDDLYSRIWNNIKQYEKVLPYSYLDTKGNITIGGGANVNNWNDYKQLNAYVSNLPATEAQKWNDYQQLRQMSNEQDAYGNYIHRNKIAKFFEPYTSIRISDSEARRLAQNHMSNDLAHLRREFADFDSFPLPLKEVLSDIQYNIGNLNQRHWPNLYQAIQNRDVDGIVSNVNRKDVGQERNDWARNTARLIRF